MAAGGETFARQGQDIESDILVTLDEIMHGSTRTINLQRIDPRTGQSNNADLAGENSSRRTGSAAHPSCRQRPGRPWRGRFRVTSTCVCSSPSHPDFRVRGANLYYDLDLSPWEAVLGASVHIPTLDGTVSLKIPPGTTAEQEFRLRGKGLPTGDGVRGDLHAIVCIQIPPKLTPEEKVLWEQLADKSTFNPRRSS